MYIGKTVFSQIMDFMPMCEFRKCVKRYDGKYNVSRVGASFCAWPLLRLTYRESLRDIELYVSTLCRKNCIKWASEEKYLGVLWLMQARIEIGESMPSSLKY